MMKMKKRRKKKEHRGGSDVVDLVLRVRLSRKNCVLQQQEELKVIQEQKQEDNVCESGDFQLQE
ncbi:hypothetical protein TWF506_006581 [Arthrobotrys conoides]|uniref:Uncharacterized protein n=1 Tax=Arthrobotrys conoides TaxID=74498 RepID=A0AAN8PLE7_9PEZI